MEKFYLVSPDRGFRFETFKRASMFPSLGSHTRRLELVSVQCGLGVADLNRAITLTE